MAVGVGVRERTGRKVSSGGWHGRQQQKFENNNTSSINSKNSAVAAVERRREWRVAAAVVVVVVVVVVLSLFLYRLPLRRRPVAQLRPFPRFPTTSNEKRERER